MPAECHISIFTCTHVQLVSAEHPLCAQVLQYRVWAQMGKEADPGWPSWRLDSGGRGKTNQTTIKFVYSSALQ